MYYVIEIQTNADGTHGTLVNNYDDRNAAMAKYHTVLSAAAVSQVLVHACAVLTREGRMVANESCVHPVEKDQ